MLAQDLSQIDIDAVARDWPTHDQLEQIMRRTHANPIIAENAVLQRMAKCVDTARLRQRLIAIRERQFPFWFTPSGYNVIPARF